MSALRCLFLIAMHHGIQLAPEELPVSGANDIKGSTLKAMRAVGLKGRVLERCSWEKAGQLGTAYPAFAIRKDGTWVVLAHVVTAADGQRFAAILDPTIEHEGVKLLTAEQFMADWSGTLVICKRVYTLTDENQPFGLRWFMPEIVRHARLFRGVAIAALMANLIGLGIPLLFQVLIDKVVSHQSYQTLFAVVLIFIILTVFDGFFSYVRQNLMLLASNKIDARLTSRTFQHLLGLPLSFFETNTAGVLVRHLQQTEKLRHFLTGRLFQVILDAATLPILIVLLVFYSGTLTCVVMAFSVAIACVIGGMVPRFRAELDRLYQTEGARQAHLVETIHGMRAVKSLVLEPLRQREWDNKVAQAVRRHASVGRIAALGTVTTGGLEKLMQISVLAVGAVEVFNGSLSLGALVAFNMLSGRVTGPLVQMVALINEYQEASLSVKMLGTVMNSVPERSTRTRPSRPVITGNINFDSVTFRYNPASNPALKQVSFAVEEGQVIGVVGRSGSGKTTITRLIQAIHSPQEGMIQLNGVDLRYIDLNHLRRSIGVVLQDNLLFRGTIRDNIAAARPDAQMPEILEAARMAGADEFINRLPMAYDTFVEENAANFSGGQRQRIAIARALLTRPRLLIFDEATSALDPESEAIVQRNLSDIARGRTMIIVSHRLSSLVTADKIIVLEQGELVDFAPHSVLLERCEIYRHLWQTQTQHIQ
ncbi:MULTISPECIES: peptidase domain-containing ABC transporter [unclassified Azospirillum]|uniref:peptidase domain-containing ABC transporter n=1 Tax=unclassified Azospirillum TaxID=2630922 RepID=UPI000B7016F8|nr:MULTISPECIES: peptidase domain-containing ABC transporter [unclassified Azospirillum]SNS49151.1 ATP-binding cassette, subfamily B [Azospirillum sp. RU38E]SNS68285.1 ATP-binding cassette, subfamily B [Azospirillum sp. RU37A]